MAGPSYTTNTGLSALPEIDQKKTPEIWAELVRIRQAINILQEALDAPGNVPAGGTIGQFLAKLSGTDYDIGWASNAHNDLASIQGGTPGEYYHLTSTEYADFLGIVGSIDETIDDRVASLLVAGANITLLYDDVANTLTISASGGGGGGVTWTTTTIDFGASYVNEGTFTVIDAAVSATSKIQVTISGTSSTATNDADSHKLASAMFKYSYTPAAGSFSLQIHTDFASVSGEFELSYAVY